MDRLLGEGATGKVYLMRDTHHGNAHVAVKVMNSDSSGGALLKEVQKLTQLSHENILKCFDAQFWVDGQVFFLVLEYCEQGSLDKYLKRIGPDKLSEVPFPTVGSIVTHLRTHLC